MTLTVVAKVRSVWELHQILRDIADQVYYMGLRGGTAKVQPSDPNTSQWRIDDESLSKQ